MTESEAPQFPKFELTGKWALITGGAGLLGKEHASALMQAGADVVLWDIHPESLATAIVVLQSKYPKRRILAFAVDITNEKDVTQGQMELEKKGILISILINNAAINPKYNAGESKPSFSRVENFDLKDWEFQLGVGLTGAFICSKIFGTLMAEIGYGIILNIASDLSVISPDQRLYEIEGVEKELQPVKPVTYSVIKSGLIGLTQYLATYWRTDGVRVNSLSPGGVYENQGNDFVEKISNLIPLGRMAHVNEYHSAVQFLCSEASSYMTGQNLVIDGGRTIW
jgi:NAD(P)-dependent dehydrogenase (short-subunit alcohol dehydrogenase family)